jgi:hypothetical protein
MVQESPFFKRAGIDLQGETGDVFTIGSNTLKLPELQPG